MVEKGKTPYHILSLDITRPYPFYFQQLRLSELVTKTVPTLAQVKQSIATTQKEKLSNRKLKQRERKRTTHFCIGFSKPGNNQYTKLSQN